MYEPHCLVLQLGVWSHCVLLQVFCCGRYSAAVLHPTLALLS